MRRHFHFFPAPRTLPPALVAGAAMGGLVWVARDLPLPVVVPVGAAAYGGLLWLISPTSREVLVGLRR
jgi:hypothetical protein